VAHQPAISFPISFQYPFNRAGGRTSNVRDKISCDDFHSVLLGESKGVAFSLDLRGASADGFPIADDEPHHKRIPNKLWLEQPAISGVVEVFGIRHLGASLEFFRQRVPAHRRSAEKSEDDEHP
jgi:hypothetical protein